MVFDSILLRKKDTLFDLIVVKVFAIDALSAATNASWISTLNNKTEVNAGKAKLSCLQVASRLAKFLHLWIKKISSYKFGESVNDFTTHLGNLIHEQPYCDITESSVSSDTLCVVPVAVNLPARSPGLIVEEKPSHADDC